MHRFDIINENINENTKLFFDVDRSTIVSVPFPRNAPYSIAVDQLEIELSEEMVFLCVHGWASWGKRKRLIPPKTIKRCVRFVPDGFAGNDNMSCKEEFEDGEVFSVDSYSYDKGWPTYFDKVSGWYVKGNIKYTDSDIAVEFAPKAIIILRDNKILSLWLHPENAHTDAIMKFFES